ncbi:MAG: tRNA (adenosine(37)-N6)-threonylcarbamoyltransferase complex transferase subunit TsaD [Candidatus Pacebacteria bacterium]|nr:tRNA (adenosine(37)-N6)-threonylcarbamoyltransferase complex transferase subunit TsaD [Candidatus Paceibacterota bacterium]
MFMKILAIDTSCDDTSVAVVEKKNNRINIISNVVSSQIKIHAPYGGVYPALAKREHQKNLVPVLIKALKKSALLKVCLSQNDANRSDRYKLHQKRKRGVVKKILKRDGFLFEKTQEFLQKYEKPSIDAIAVTNGPGLEPCLWQGVNFAKALSFWWDLPLTPVNHIKAHLSANFISGIPTTATFPAVGLVASGGHTEIVLMRQINKYKLIGSTRDDASGECFDKTARILGLPYPGGPAIATIAATECKIQGSKFKVELPRPMINSGDFDFSFSGLKTAVLYDCKKRKKDIKESQEYKILMAKEIQQAIIDVLITKTIKAAKRFQVKSIITGGGVMSNKELRKQFRDKIKSAKLRSMFYVPNHKLCLDNAAMVGTEALIIKPKIQSWQKIKVNGNLNI